MSQVAEKKGRGGNFNFSALFYLRNIEYKRTCAIHIVLIIISNIKCELGKASLVF